MGGGQKEVGGGGGPLFMVDFILFGTWGKISTGTLSCLQMQHLFYFTILFFSI